MKEFKLTLTDSEWMALIDGSEDREGLQACCGNISDLRDAIIQIAREGTETVWEWYISTLTKALIPAVNSHPELLKSVPELAKLVKECEIDLPKIMSCLNDRL